MATLARAEAGSLANVAAEVSEAAKKASRNRFAVDSKATGAHTVFRRDPATVRISYSPYAKESALWALRCRAQLTQPFVTRSLRSLVLGQGYKEKRPLGP